MAFTRWVRKMSQDQLLTSAKTKMAARVGLPSRRPEGKDLFWQKVYAPVFYRLPIPLRDKVVAAMPGSHRQTWHQPAQVSGPAKSISREWPKEPVAASRNVHTSKPTGRS